jgi:hypothetical protein
MAFSAMPFWKWTVVEDVDAVLLGKVLKGLFDFHHLFGGKFGHEVDVLQS